jgi:IS30 family transposase
MTDEAWNMVKNQLAKRCSPEEVTQWLKKEYPLYAMSGKTIYTYVVFHLKGELKKLILKDLRLRGKNGEKRERNEEEYLK